MLKFWLVVASCILCSALPASAQTSTITFGLSGSVVNSNKSYSSVDADVTALLQWGSVAYAALVLAQPPTVQFTGSISGTTLTATAVASGNLAKELGGEIRVHSDGPGRGARFALCLPLAPSVTMSERKLA